MVVRTIRNLSDWSDDRRRTWECYCKRRLAAGAPITYSVVNVHKSGDLMHYEADAQSLAGNLTYLERSCSVVQGTVVLY